jgi:superfamily II DNA or RNA helicase
MEKFIVILTESRHLGVLAVPYLANDSEGSPSISLIEKVNTEDPKKHDYSFSPQELMIIESLQKVSDKYLHKIFSKDKTIKLFYDNLDVQKFENLIRPHIEKYMWNCFSLLSEFPQIPIYFKDVKYSNLYKTDRIKLITNKVEPVFYFDLSKEGISYTLKIKLPEGDMSVTHKNPMVITQNPCCLLIQNKLFQIEKIDSKKFTPFFTKSEIKIPERSTPTYLETFVLNAIKNNHVIANGFSIIEDQTTPKAILSLEETISNELVLVLKFKYAQKEYLCNSQSKVAVQLEHTKEHYAFIKYKRDLTWEKNIIDFLQEKGLQPQSGAHFTTKSSTEENGYETSQHIIFWIYTCKSDLNKRNIEIIQDTLENRYYVGMHHCQFTTQKEQDWFDLQMIVRIGDFNIPFIKLRKCIISGKSEYKLPNGEIFIIPKEWFSKYTDILLYAEEKNGKIRLNKMYYNLVEEPSKAQHRQFYEKTLPQSSHVPEALQANLRPYQLQGYRWMNFLNENNFGGILADDMGLGKTLQTITLLLKVYEQNQQLEQTEDNTGNINGKTSEPQLFETSHLEGFNTSGLPSSLVVMPTSLIHNWYNELKKFAPSLKVYIYSGTKRLKSKEIGQILRHYHVVLSSYGVLRNDIDYLKNYHFHYFILDESQYIKNPASKIYDAVMEVNCNRKMVLTGTPIENSLSDLWAQMNFVNHGLLGNHSFFKRQFVIPISKQQSEEQEAKLQKLIEPFVLRRTKEKVAKDLPPVTEQIMFCDMTKEQQKVYDSEKSGIRNELLKTFAANGIEKSTFLALQGLTRLRQIANHPKLVHKDFKGESGKFNTIIDNLESIVNEHHKVLVFSSFVQDLELIEHELKKRHIKYSKLTGATTKRESVVDDFEKNTDCRVFLISLKAGGVGLNLISADYVFMLNPWWNPAAESQAINRAHRIGQTKNVFVYRFISIDTIEEKIMKLQEYKSQLADTFINSNNPFKNMNESEIKELFS